MSRIPLQERLAYAVQFAFDNEAAFLKRFDHEIQNNLVLDNSKGHTDWQLEYFYMSGSQCLLKIQRYGIDGTWQLTVTIPTDQYITWMEVVSAIKLSPPRNG